MLYFSRYTYLDNQLSYKQNWNVLVSPKLVHQHASNRVKMPSLKTFRGQNAVHRALHINKCHLSSFHSKYKHAVENFEEFSHFLNIIEHLYLIFEIKSFQAHAASCTAFLKICLFFHLIFPFNLAFLQMPNS